MIVLLTIGMAYLIGSIPIEWWVVRHRPSSFAAPSLTALHRQQVVILLVIDLLKGIIATLIGFLLGGWLAACLAAIAVVTGSIYSVFGGSNGGKGLAVAAGTMLVLSPLLMLIGIVIYLISLLLTRYLFVATCLTVVAVLLLGLVLVSHFYVWLVLLFLGVIVLFSQRPHRRGFRKGRKPPFRFRNPFA
ncbi:glycerol-3-phosphate acyltransferase [Lihuaxuella thermophila]|uniref:Glycerol-3-phosphate acyltransferase PlsY n=1 Tax=Lihuaxuella thermophila TaxID=1173111 RepID=A0A1H8C6Z1_9BACL|nr:glycerol-3-phosphate acyltransferase [Lihuaxuella thermophila]SEM90843.1 glycerol-3-phosphate acyltransferase PlsY [Lihuaxuella thermophila]